MIEIIIGGILRTQDQKLSFKIELPTVELAQQYKQKIQDYLEKEGCRVITRHGYFDKQEGMADYD